MILCINYADESSGRLFRPWQKLQTQTAYLFGADKVIEYSPKDIPQWFYEKNKFILDKKTTKDSPKYFYERNSPKLYNKIVIGHGLWKPFIIRDALSKVQDGDYVFYIDSGMFFVNNAPPLIIAMQKANTCVMPLSLSNSFLEKYFSKRDAFILMDCDNEETANTPQRDSSHIFIKKCPESVALIDEFLVYAQDPRIITDMPNQLGKEDYDGFKGRRNDQTVWSLLTKKRGYNAFRDASQYFPPVSKSFSEDVMARSNYPVILYHHRMNMLKIFSFTFVPQFISIATRIQSKEHIPKEFQYGLPKVFQEGLAYQISEYTKQYGSAKFPANLPSPKEILERYHELHFPENPYFKETIANMPKSLY